MLIRSTDKKRIMNLDATRKIDVCSGKEDGMYAISIDDWYVGEYKSEQRALEVLDEICNAYISLNDKDRKTGFSYVKNGIYRMPEE